CEEVEHVGRRGCLAEALGLPWLMRRTLEEECNGDLQDLRDVLDSARADSVGALLVLLDLLECQAERVTEVCLAHRKHHPPHAYAAADVLVDRVGDLLGHPVALSLCRRRDV